MSTPDLKPVYQGALDLLREGGWCQERSRTPDGKRCLVQALDDAAPSCTDYEQAWVKLRRITKCPGVAQWNDNPKRTFAEVEALLLQAMA